MNEQIAKFANESGFDVDKTGTFGNYSEIHRLEKFAELIVKECAAMTRNLSPHGELAEKAVKEHFGVKE